MAGSRDPKELEQLERFRRGIARNGAPGEEGAWPQGPTASALEQLRRAAEVARLTEQQNQEMQARGQELAARVAEELELATARIRSAEARAHAAEVRAATAEARVAEIQQWLDSVHNVIVEEFGPNLLEEAPGERRAGLPPPQPPRMRPP
jgi:hypothetical protein